MNELLQNKNPIRAAQNRQRGHMRPAGRQFDMPGLGCRFLTRGSCTPKGLVERVQGVHKDHKSKVMNPLIPLLQLSHGPKVIVIDT